MKRIYMILLVVYAIYLKTSAHDPFFNIIRINEVEIRAGEDCRADWDVPDTRPKEKVNGLNKSDPQEMDKEKSMKAIYFILEKLFFSSGSCPGKKKNEAVIPVSLYL